MPRGTLLMPCRRHCQLIILSTIIVRIDLIAQCGKLAITRCILQAERSSNLYVDPSNIFNTINFKRSAQTWFNAFFQLLTENSNEDDLLERFSKVAIVCFNYDRCIEHYLFSSLKNYYDLPNETAVQILGALQIYHPYGVVGTLPWQQVGNSISYGGSPQPAQLIELAKGLKTFTEGVNPEHSEIIAVRSTLANARRIAFLGFAFHDLNLDLLFPKGDGGVKPIGCHVYATADGISDSDIKLVSKDIHLRSGIRDANIQMRKDTKCAGLFHEYWRSLSLLKS